MYKKSKHKPKIQQQKQDYKSIIQQIGDFAIMKIHMFNN